MRSDQVTVQQRVEEVLQLRLLGAELHDIRQYASSQTPPWNVGDRQLWRYIEAGDALLARTLEKDRAKLLNRHLAQRRALYARAVAVSDYRAALAILKDEGDLLHLYEAMPGEREAGADASPVDSARVVQVLAARLCEVDRSELPTGEKARLTATLADSLLRAIGVDIIDKRLEALRTVLLGRKEKDKK